MILLQINFASSDKSKTVCEGCYKTKDISWYYCISPNFHTLAILLQVNPTSSDKSKTVCEGCYKTEDISSYYCISLNFCTLVILLQALEENWVFITNQFVTSYDYLTFTTIVGYIYNYFLHLVLLATTL